MGVAHMQQIRWWATPIRRSTDGVMRAGRSCDVTSEDVRDALVETVLGQRERGLALRNGDGVRLTSGADLSSSDHVLVDDVWTSAPPGWYW